MDSIAHSIMTKLDQAMQRHMEYVVQVEQRPFSYKDFESFPVDGHYYSASHGTCRNKFSQLYKKGLIELEYNFKVSYYTLKGHHFGNRSSMTRNHMGIFSVIPVTGVIGIEMQGLCVTVNVIKLRGQSVMKNAINRYVHVYEQTLK